MTFAWPWLAALIPVWLVIARWKQKPVVSGAIEHPYLAALSQQSTKGVSEARWLKWVNALIYLLLVLALMRPQWIGDPLSTTERARSLYLSVDISESMLEPDMQWNGQIIQRYQAVQAVIGEFVSNRQSDLIGLVVFGAFADIQSPLTPDTKAIQKLLLDLLPGMAGGSTAIGDGLALAVKQLRDSTSTDKVVILLSDGVNNSGSVTPEQATQVARESGIKVYTIGFGRSRFGQQSFDAATLSEIAEQTGGRFFQARTTGELIDVFAAIEALEPSDEYQQELRVVNEWYWLPLTIAGLLLIIQWALSLWPSKRVTE